MRFTPARDPYAEVVPVEVVHAPNVRGTRIASGAVRAVSVVAAVVAVPSFSAFIVLEPTGFSSVMARVVSEQFLT